MNSEIRNNWTLDEIREIYFSPVLELILRGAEAHKKYQLYIYPDLEHSLGNKQTRYDLFVKIVQFLKEKL